MTVSIVAAGTQFPSASVHRIQEAQTTAYHVLWSLVQSDLNG